MNPLEPDVALLCKLGSIVVHVDEYLGPHGQAFDFDAIRGLLADPKIKEWLELMDDMALLPKQRYS